MGLLSSSKSNSATNAATDASNVVTGSKAQVGSLNLGERSAYLESGAFSNTGTVKSGLADAKITAGAGATVTIGEPGLGETFAATVKDLFASALKPAAPATAAASVGPSWAQLPAGIEFGNGSQGGALVPAWLKSPAFLIGAGLVGLGFVWLIIRRRAG